MSHALHTHTPTLKAVDGRGLMVREIAWRKTRESDPLLESCTRLAYDAQGRLVSMWDPRLSALAERGQSVTPNLAHCYNLAGTPLLNQSVDAGWRLSLQAEAGTVVQSWDARGSTWRTDYDECLRPVAVVEIEAGNDARTISRMVYADDSTASAEHNQCGRLIRCDDTAGTLHVNDYGVRGQVLDQSRQFLKTFDLPDWEADTDYSDWLETEAFSTQWRYNALEQPVLQTDARRHAQRFSYSAAGDLNGVYLQLNGGTETTLVQRVTYNAFGQIEEQTAGNGVKSRAVYDSASSLLQSLTASRAGDETLQSLHYSYDPVGNILQIEDTAQPVRFHANQRVEPVSRYTYDTLYQLIEATGREVNTGTSHGPALPALQNLPLDPNRVSHYTQSYDYDSAGNLLQMRHVGAQSFTRTMRVAPDSNRSLPENEVDADFEEAFDPNGNLLHLIRGQTLDWDPRNQLRQITTVARADTASDHERYLYDGQGQRCRKLSSAQRSNRTLNNEVRYLPGLEIRTTADGEILHVITAHHARVLHWEAGLPSGVTNDQWRYQITDHQGSSTLELDQHGGLISQESYYPFGGTSWWAARSAVEAKYKTIRYSGKERDASGLYYYGFRYYAPWLQRWINPDPAGDVDGLNLFRFSRNSPTVWIDPSGASPFKLDDILSELNEAGDPVKATGLQNISRWNPQFGGTLAIALTASRKGLAFARAKINKELSPFAHSAHRETLLRYFRTESESDYKTDTDILSLTSQRIGRLASFLESWNSEKMIGVGGKRESQQVAWQYTNDPQHHIFMRESHVNESAHRAAWNIIHESSHIALDTKDLWYINTPGASPTGAQGVASYGGRINILADLQRIQFRNETMIWDGPDVASFDSADFTMNPLQRARIILKNADSIALLASYINQRFDGPLAPIAVVHERPSIVPALTIPPRSSPKSESRRFSL